MHPHIKFGIPTSKNIGDMHRTRSGKDIVISIKTKSEVKVKVTVTRKWYATLGHPKMHPHTKFGILTSKNIGDIHRTQSGKDRRTDSAITICLPKFLWGHKNKTSQVTSSLFPKRREKASAQLQLDDCTTRKTRKVKGPALSSSAI